MNPEQELRIPASRNGKVFVLVHGGAHGAWAFQRLATLLVQEGHYVIAQDLPGHGLQARFPSSYLEAGRRLGGTWRDTYRRPGS